MMRNVRFLLLPVVVSFAALGGAYGASDPSGSNPAGGSDATNCASPADRDLPAAGTRLTVAAAQGLVGLCLADAEAWAEANGFRVRIIERDGESLIVTADYSESRINVALADGMINRVTNIG